MQKYFQKPSLSMAEISDFMAHASGPGLLCSCTARAQQRTLTPIYDHFYKPSMRRAVSVWARRKFLRNSKFEVWPTPEPGTKTGRNFQARYEVRQYKSVFYLLLCLKDFRAIEPALQPGFAWGTEETEQDQDPSEHDHKSTKKAKVSGRDKRYNRLCDPETPCYFIPFISRCPQTSICCQKLIRHLNLPSMKTRL